MQSGEHHRSFFALRVDNFSRNKRIAVPQPCRHACRSCKQRSIHDDFLLPIEFTRFFVKYRLRR